MMTARRYIEEDLREVNRWYAMQELPVLEHEDMPAIGYIVPGVCAGFLYQTDSSMCMIDGYIANPEARGEKRKNALDAVTYLLITTAQDLNYKAIMAYTKTAAVSARCERYEFQPKGEYKLFVRRM